MYLYLLIVKEGRLLSQRFLGNAESLPMNFVIVVIVQESGLIMVRVFAQGVASLLRLVVA